MNLTLQRTELINATPWRVFQILTAYENYPFVFPMVTSAKIIRRTENEVEVQAHRSTLFFKHVRFIDHYLSIRADLYQIERTYPAGEGPSDGSRSIWTIEPAHNEKAYFTVWASSDLPFFPGLLMRPYMEHVMFYKLNFPPIIRAAQSAA